MTDLLSQSSSFGGLASGAFEGKTLLERRLALPDLGRGLRGAGDGFVGFRLRLDVSHAIVGGSGGAYR